jgi:hypothetical protein
MTKAVKPNLESEYEANTNRSEWFGYFLLAGLCVELLFAVFLNKPLIEWISAVVSDIMIVVGVWGEIHFGRKARILGDTLQAEANARAAEANEKAERERTARFELEERLAPRIFSLPQRNELVASIHGFEDTEADIISYAPGFPEVTAASGKVRDALFAAGWNIRQWTAIGSAQALVGVWVAIRPGSPQEIGRAARAGATKGRLGRARIPVVPQMGRTGTVPGTRRVGSG